MSEEKVRKIKASGLPRMKMPEQDPVRRASNFEEVPYGISLEMAMDEASRCLQTVRGVGYRLEDGDAETNL